ncbi:MAG: LacI family DNA-binding transcriptional regulator [Planctomycetaceae bacterium]|nr:LacI family DNA-binding transcriptional regulator [Planctomycetaceae bacterium]
MKTLKIHSELQTLLPALSEKEYAGLEKDILERGCISAIAVWNDAIVDGHNRYEICQKHGLPFEVKPLEFASLDDAMFWAWTHQENRRNLAPFQKVELALRFKPQVEKQARERQRGGQGGVLLKQNSAEAKERNTRDEIAKLAGVSTDTVSRVEFLDKHADEETKEKLRQGKTTVNKEYKRVKEKTAKPTATKPPESNEEPPVTEPETPEPPPSKNTPCINELVSVRRTTLKDIRQDHPNHLITNLNMHFREGYIEELIIEAMAYLHAKNGAKVTTPIAQTIAKLYLKSKR